MIKDKDKTPVAQNVVTMCTKCKMELSHVVIAHNAAGIVARVKCNTCGSEHKYNPEKKNAPAKAVRAKRKSTRAQKMDYGKEFEKLAEKFKEKAAVHYSMSASFRADDVIDHRTFGRGIVMSVSHQKMEVAFPDRPRVLACDK